ncbi:MAG: hypothetical protein FWE87_03865 [Coriobacteriia bacterium]|nr:hypothetical protein [Coriobacteriia bacterium]
MPNSTENTNETFTTEVEQYTFDQSLANDENTGMVAAVFVNIIILAIAVVAILIYARKKAHKSS